MSGIFYILVGNNGATYIFNAKSLRSINYSLRFYKARNLKQALKKILLGVFLFIASCLPKLHQKHRFRTIDDVGCRLASIVGEGIPFELDDECSVLISSTGDKVIVHHHGEYFQKYATGTSLSKVHGEVEIYSYLDKRFANFSVSKLYDSYEEEAYCCFKLSSIPRYINRSIPKEDVLVLALTELFCVVPGKNCYLAEYVDSLGGNLSNLDDPAMHTLQRILVQVANMYRGFKIPLGLVHGDFKPWNINNKKDFLIYDFEEAVTEGAPLEDLLNYFVDPLIRYISAKRVANHVFQRSRVKLYDSYLQRMNLDIDFRALLYIYLVGRVVFWSSRDEPEVAQKYADLANYVFSTHGLQ
ncbi:MAG: hypothetical protein ABJL54_08160 [Halioglobus sp.]